MRVWAKKPQMLPMMEGDYTLFEVIGESTQTYKLAGWRNMFKPEISKKYYLIKSAGSGTAYEVLAANTYPENQKPEAA